MSDPAALAQLRTAMVTARSAWEADLIERLSDAESMIAALQSELAARREEVAARGEELALAQAQAGAHAETLSRIYAGGCWHLRARLAPLIAVYRGLRAVRSRL